MVLEEIFTENNSNMITHNNMEKSLIVLSAPSVENDYYLPDFNEIIDYMIDFANLVHGKDEVVIFADAGTIPLLKERVRPDILIEAVIEDIWIRDFSSVIPSKQVKFKYLPSYNPSLDSKATERSFEKYFEKNELEYHTESEIILDGGNVVDNAAGTRVIVTERILQDNPLLTKSDAKNKLKQLLRVNEVAIIPEPPNDTTGHADGSVMWPMDDKILLIKGSEPEHTETVDELKISFPGVEIVEIPNYIPNTFWHNFNSAENCYVNSIVTDNYIYMPTFNNQHDAEMLELFQSHTNKTVIPIPAENVCKMGGSVRCLSWQVKNMNKIKLLQLVEE
jgi:agmatine/peptidylarginine deiminase